MVISSIEKALLCYQREASEKHEMLTPHITDTLTTRSTETKRRI